MTHVIPAESRVAWGDESARVVADPPAYLMAATIFDSDPFAALNALERLKPSHAAKLHWRDLGERTQEKAVEAISAMRQATTIVTASPLERNKQERARRKCLQALLVELESRGIDCLVLESRDAPLDKKDGDFSAHLHRCHAIANIRILHARGSENPRLYVPDLLLGAYGDAFCSDGRRDKSLERWSLVARSVELREIRL